MYPVMSDDASTYFGSVGVVNVVERVRVMSIGFLFGVRVGEWERGVGERGVG